MTVQVEIGGSLDDSHNQMPCIKRCLIKMAVQFPELILHVDYRYMEDREHAQDDSPLYIFDGSFAEKKGSRSMRHDYSIPSLFSEDLMRLGGEHRRPPYR